MLNYIIRGLERGKTLKEISRDLEHCDGYVSNWLKKHKHNIDFKKYNTKNKCNEKRKKLYDIIKTHIHNKLSTTDISKKIKKSNPHVLKIVSEYGDTKTKNQLHLNNNHSKSKGLRKTYGHAKGKTYEQLYGDKAEEMKQARSRWLRKNNIRKYAKRVSKPQKMLYEIVKEKYSDTVLDYRYKISDDKFIWLDVVIPSLKINIEYDGKYWHQHNQNTIRVKDIERDKILRKDGWKVYRMEYITNPSKETLENDFLKLNIKA